MSCTAETLSFSKYIRPRRWLSPKRLKSALLFVLLARSVPSRAGNDAVDSALKQLDRAVAIDSLYTRKKIDEIERLKGNLRAATLPLVVSATLTWRLHRKNKTIAMQSARLANSVQTLESDMSRQLSNASE